MKTGSGGFLRREEKAELKQETVHGRLEKFQRETKEKGVDSPKQREDRQEER